MQHEVPDEGIKQGGYLQMSQQVQSDHSNNHNFLDQYNNKLNYIFTKQIRFVLYKIMNLIKKTEMCLKVYDIN